MSAFGDGRLDADLCRILAAPDAQAGDVLARPGRRGRRLAIIGALLAIGVTVLAAAQLAPRFGPFARRDGEPAAGSAGRAIVAAAPLPQTSPAGPPATAAPAPEPSRIAAPTASPGARRKGPARKRETPRAKGDKPAPDARRTARAAENRAEAERARPRTVRLAGPRKTVRIPDPDRAGEAGRQAEPKPEKRKSMPIRRGPRHVR